jgi:hypothetical protein
MYIIRRFSESIEKLVRCDSRQVVGPYGMQGMDLHRSRKS